LNFLAKRWIQAGMYGQIMRSEFLAFAIDIFGRNNNGVRKGKAPQNNISTTHLEEITAH